MTIRWPIVAVALLAAPALRADDEVPALKKLAEAQVKRPLHLAVSEKGGEIAVTSDLDVQVRDARALKLTKTYRGVANRAAFALGEKALIISGVTRTGIEQLDRESGESVILNYGEPE